VEASPVLKEVKRGQVFIHRWASSNSEEDLIKLNESHTLPNYASEIPVLSTLRPPEGHVLQSYPLSISLYLEAYL
jgi:hypothetical protein